MRKFSFFSLFILLLCIFLFSGGTGIIVVALNGGVTGVWEARNIVTAPFFGGFILMGTFGLVEAHNHPRDRGKVLVGCAYALFSYVGIEVLFKVVNPA